MTTQPTSVDEAIEYLTIKFPALLDEETRVREENAEDRDKAEVMSILLQASIKEFKAELRNQLTTLVEQAKGEVVDYLEKQVEYERWSEHTMSYDTRKEIPVHEVNELCLASHNNLVDSLKKILTAARTISSDKK